MNRRAAAAAALALAAAPGAASAEAARVYAQVNLNGADTDQVLEFQAEGDALSATPDQLDQIGLKVPAGRDPVALSAIPGVRYVFHPDTQSIDIIAEPRALKTRRIGAAPAVSDPFDRPAWGGLVNYAVYAAAAPKDGVSATGFGELRAFGPPGMLSTTFLVHSSTAGGQRRLQRLDTALVLPDPDNLRRTVIGDFITSGLAWTRPVRAAGISFARDFSMRPDLITAPLPDITGSAAVPAAVDLYIDGVKRMQTQTASGPFSINRAPVVDGRGEVSLVVTDALGRQSVQNFPFYSSSSLLRPGLSAFAAEAGAIRRDYGGLGDRYDEPFALVSGRRGLTGHVTLEAYGEVSKPVQDFGAGLVGKLGEQALLAAAVRASNGFGGKGLQLYASAERQTRKYSLYASYQQSFGHFGELAALDNGYSIRKQLRLGGSLTLGGRWGAVNASYTRLRTSQEDIGTASAGWSRSLPFGASLYVNGYMVANGPRDKGVTIGMTVPLGRQTVASAAATASSHDWLTSAAASRNPPAGGGLGWRAAVQDSGQGGATVQGDLRAALPDADAEIGAAYANGRAAARGYISGSAVMIGGEAKLARRLGDSFALVDTGLPGVGVDLENQKVGKTDANGRLLVTGLTGYTPNHIAIEPESVPIYADILTPERSTRPFSRTGVVVRMDVRQANAATVRLLGEDSKPLPLGSKVRVDGRASGVIGYDGAAYLTGIGPHSNVEVSGEWGRCEAPIPYKPARDLPDLGAIVCEAAAAARAMAAIDFHALAAAETRH